MSKVYRLHYRAQFKEETKVSDAQEAIVTCVENVRKLQAEGKILTAALYYADKMLFLYYEAMGEALSVVEPVAMQPALQKAWEYGGIRVSQIGGQETDFTEEKKDAVVESGEDVQLTVVHPAEFLAPLTPYLCVWPGQKGERFWVHMYHIYYHSVPKSAEDWKRATIPNQRRGRIAFLRDDKLFSYTYFHKAIVDEGLLTGDRYQSIALHENILFSYFEEPKTFTNIKNNLQEKSKVIEGWMAVDPESHFIHMPEGEGENFMFLPALFALGVEDVTG